jgi:Methyltransferase small domain
MSWTEQPVDELESLSREIYRITGKRIPARQIHDLLGLDPLSSQRLNRFFQDAVRIQLRKGQSELLLQAIHKVRDEAISLTEIPIQPSGVDSDLPALITPQAKQLAKALRDLFQEVYFDQVNHDLRLPEYGGDYQMRPFPLPDCPVDAHTMKLRLRDAVRRSRATDDAKLARRIQHAFAFFMFGEPLNRAVLGEVFDGAANTAINDGLDVGLFVAAGGQMLRMNGLSLFSRQLRNGEVIYIFADTPPHFESRMAEPRVYIGADSYELMDRISEIASLSGYCVEMGSGSGVQMIAALKQHPAIVKIIGKERDRRAIHVSLFNAALNGVENKVMIAGENDALSSLLEDQTASFAMTNPPFLALPDWIDIDPQDLLALSTGMNTRVTDRGFQADLRELFPEAGWGGEDGLQVTKQFVQTLLPVLSPLSQIVIYSQFAGDERGPALLQDYIRKIGAFSFAFEPVKPRSLAVMNAERTGFMEGQTVAILSSSQSAATVSSLIVSALMARQDPTRVRAAVRTGGPEHALMLMFARRIEDSYQSQGITHFHDGFVVLTSEAALQNNED